MIKTLQATAFIIAILFLTVPSFGMILAAIALPAIALSVCYGFLTNLLTSRPRE